MTLLDLSPTAVAAGWAVTGEARGHGQPPAPPPRPLVADLLDAGQLAALDDYTALVERLAQSRSTEGALGALVNAAVRDDWTAADEAVAANAGTAPPTVLYERQAGLDRQHTYSEACLRAASGALGALRAALTSPEALRRLVEAAWAAVVDERRRDPEHLRRPVEVLCWVLDVPNTPSVRTWPELAALDGLPRRSWEDGLEQILDGLAGRVAEMVAALDEAGST